MSCTISISEKPEDIWIVRNAIFDWLVKLVAKLHPDATDVVEQLRISSYVGGMSLDLEMQRNPERVPRIVTVLRDVAREIADGKHTLTDYGGRPWPELQEQTIQAFAELTVLLERYHERLP